MPAPDGRGRRLHHVSGPPDPVDIIQDLGRRGSLFITRPAIMHYVAKRTDLEWTAQDLLKAIGDGILDANINKAGRNYTESSLRNSRSFILNWERCNCFTPLTALSGRVPPSPVLCPARC